MYDDKIQSVSQNPQQDGGQKEPQGKKLKENQLALSSHQKWTCTTIADHHSWIYSHISKHMDGESK